MAEIFKGPSNTLRDEFRQIILVGYTERTRESKTNMEATENVQVVEGATM